MSQTNEINLQDIIIRGFREDEWELLRDKRLEAVKAHNNVYLRTYEEVAAYDENRWRGMITQKEGKVFGLFDGRKLIGLTGVFRNEQDTSGKSAMLGMSYIEGGYRGRGLSRLLYEARIEWARAAGYEIIVVSHKEGNEASRRANAAFGFKWVRSEEITFGDGSRALEHSYELRLT